METGNRTEGLEMRMKRLYSRSTRDMSEVTAHQLLTCVWGEEGSGTRTLAKQRRCWSSIGMIMNSGRDVGEVGEGRGSVVEREERLANGTRC